MGQVIVSAPPFTSTVLRCRVINAPWPLESVMPTSLIAIEAPLSERRRMPPVGPGRTLIMRPFPLGVWRVIEGTPGGDALAIAGTSAALPKKPPTQIG